MKFIFFLVLSFYTLLSFSQDHKAPKMKYNNEEFFINNPPNCSLLYDSVFIDKTEITNLHWLEYLYTIKKDSSKAFYDSQIIDSAYHHVDSLNLDYLHYPQFRMYPVIGVSFEQANAYCKWRSDVVNKAFNFLNVEKKYIKQRELLKEKGIDIYYEFRLPTISEWEYAASGGLKFEDFPHGIIKKINKITKKSFLSKGQKITNKNSCLESLKEDLKKSMELFELQSNVKEDYWVKSTNTYINCNQPNEISTTEVFKFTPNNYQLYDMIGNIAEMISEKGVAKGGSFRDSYDDFNIKTNINYDRPQEWLGFRCICVVHFRKTSKFQK